MVSLGLDPGGPTGAHISSFSATAGATVGTVPDYRRIKAWGDRPPQGSNRCGAAPDIRSRLVIC